MWNDDVERRIGPAGNVSVLCAPSLLPPGRTEGPAPNLQPKVLEGRMRGTRRPFDQASVIPLTLTLSPRGEGT